uniref:Tyrosine-protein phosphatase non-receptor type 20 n=1 Tax=Phallusia mammillata TaxID=59560 RepID=A0A6F9DPC6_9ASCI|nr:phosphatidylinositol phosphatase PTPRQ [Phallusia mammillata]
MKLCWSLSIFLQVVDIRAWRLANTTESPILAPDVREHVIGGLDEFNSYVVTVSAITSKGNLSSEAVMVDTHEDVPSDFPQDFKVSTVLNNSTAVKVLFSAPSDPNGRISQYTIEYRLKDSQDVTEIIVPSSSLSQLLTSKEVHSWPVVGLLGGRSYTFRIRASTAVGPGPWSLWTTDLTVLPISAAPVPELLPGPATVTSGPSGQPLVTSPSTSFAVKSPCVFSDVNGPLASISVIVAQDGSDLEKEPTDWYEGSVLDPTPPYKVIFSSNPAVDCADATGFVISPPQGNTRRRRAVGDLPSGSFVVGDDETCSEVNKPFCNGPLKTDTEYRVKYRAETTNGAITDTPYSEKLRTGPSFLEAHQTLIIGVAAAVGAFIIILVTSVVILRRRSRGKSDSDDPDFVVSVSGNSPRKAVPLEGSFEECKGPITESSAHSNMAFVLEPSHDDKVAEVAVARTNSPGRSVSGNDHPSPAHTRQVCFRRPVLKPDFAGHVTRLSLQKNKGFSGEFDDIRGLPVAGTTLAAEKQFNRAKNRHAKLVPFDHSRVKLEVIPAIEGSDYINASFIPGPQSAEQFVVTQTPLEHTRKDFWRLIWETGATTIVMLCSNQEEGKKKNGDYWPKKQTEYYGNLAVQLTHEDTQLDWVIRQFSITMRDKVRHLTQFQLVSWPVHEQSDNAQTVLRFVQTVRANRKAKSTPIVVMCTSGSGRCGVFVCLDRMLDNLSNSLQVDVFGTVAALRRYRPYMVQTLTEYILIHRCIWEAINQKVIGEEQFQRPPTGDGLEETVF